MPYIRQAQRDKIEPLLRPLINALGNLPDGAVNYAITRIIDGLYSHGGYDSMNRAIGILECVKQEYVRRRLNPYEDFKRTFEGEVYL